MGNVYFKGAFAFTTWKSKARIFTEKREAEEEADQLGGIVEEVTDERS